MSEKCEWNPVQNAAATIPPTPGDCQNEATLSVGLEGAWHICDSCAALPEFSRYRRKHPLRQSAQTVSGDHS